MIAVDALLVLCFFFPLSNTESYFVTTKNQHLMKLETNATDISTLLQQVYGDEAMSRTHVSVWLKMEGKTL